MENRELSALDAYVNRVYRIIVLIIPVFCMCASTTITTLHALGLYSAVSNRALLLFDLSDLLYLAVGIYFFRTGFGEDGIVKPDKLRAGKYAMAIILLIQWNAISYLWPFTDFWAFALLFTIVLAFFFDVRLVLFSTIGIVISMVISWLIHPDMLLPAHDEYFVANMTFRLVGLALMLLSINLITYFGGRFLIEELEKYINYDTLTHLLNRRSMDNYLQASYRMAKTGKSTFCLLMMDIDDFKQVNDTYGHDCGDMVLRYVSRTIAEAVDGGGNVFRWGGEEILALLNMDMEQAMCMADCIRKRIEEGSVMYRGEIEVRVTVTIGITQYSKGATIQKMMDEADARLYYGKRHGKNQVVCQ